MTDAELLAKADAGLHRANWLVVQNFLAACAMAAMSKYAWGPRVGDRVFSVCMGLLALAMDGMLLLTLWYRQEIRALRDELVDPDPTHNVHPN